MKILILSDSHGVTKLMADIIAKHRNHAACTLFLGDYLRDIKIVAGNFPNMIFHAVPGNCDFSSNLPRELTIEAGGKKIWMSHGDHFGVKNGYGRIEAAALARRADICLFGHSHIPIAYEKNGILFLNPGSITEPRGQGGKSYAVVEILGKAVLPKIIEV
jgi:putative phosphoesterase